MYYDYIENNIKDVLQRVKAASLRGGRGENAVTVIAVSKFVEPERVQCAVDMGLKILAENHVSEMTKKYPLIRGASWHIIGHLQTNKVKNAVGKAELIHSVDSERLMEAIDSAAKKMNIIQDILLEINISGEESKFGLTIDEFSAIIKKMDQYPNLRLRGIMTMAPNYSDKEMCRPIFKKAAQLFKELKAICPSADILSMGMSGDFEIAVEEGATHVRIGSAIFKRREG